jgi:hypothetical protein
VGGGVGREHPDFFEGRELCMQWYQVGHARSHDDVLRAIERELDLSEARLAERAV